MAPKIRVSRTAEIHEHEVAAPMRRRNPAALKPPVMVSGEVPPVGKVAPHVGFAIARAIYTEFEVHGSRLSPWPVVWTRSLWLI